ncbi:MAG TPA: polysaccharide pyruvyl transferase family protein [Dehalococcoidia bacterium]|nr:polysaccharide pyruvyl transferase family protein [Dehalococcoidia bacterium]
MTRVLVAGWFSFEGMGATAGDIISRDLACEWLRSAGHDVDIAVAPPFTGGVDWRGVEPADYAQVVFVCGPFGNGWPVAEFLDRFRGCRLAGLNLSMIEPVEVWNPFDVLIERDSSRRARPDLTFIAPPARVPVVGVVLVHPQSEYAGAMHQEANDAVARLVASRELAAVPVDTRLDVNETGLRTPAEVESLIARMDCVVTTRLHGMALAIRCGIPPLVIDPFAGGRKVQAQAQALGWDVAFTADSLDDERLSQALDYCLSDAARREAMRVRDRAIRAVERTRDEFVRELARVMERTV